MLLKYLRLLKFGAVGIINTAVDFAMFTVSTEALGLPPAAAQSVGYGSGIICSFMLNHVFTFSDAGRESAAGEARRFFRFIVVNGVSWAVSAAMMYALTEAGLWEYFAKVIVTAVTMVINYWGYKVLVFKIRGR